MGTQLRFAFQLMLLSATEPYWKIRTETKIVLLFFFIYHKKQHFIPKVESVGVLSFDSLICLSFFLAPTTLYQSECVPPTLPGGRRWHGAPAAAA